MPQMAFHARTIYSDIFENVTINSTHQENIHRILPRSLPSVPISHHSHLVHWAWTTDTPSKIASNYVEFKIIEISPSHLWCPRNSDFPLKNAPCKNTSFCLLHPFDLRMYLISACMLYLLSLKHCLLPDLLIAPVTNSREYQKKYNDSMQMLVRLFGPGKSVVSSPNLLDDSEDCWTSKTQCGRFIGFNKDNPRLISSRIMASGRKREVARLFEVRPEYPYPFDYIARDLRYHHHRPGLGLFILVTPIYQFDNKLTSN